MSKSKMYRTYKARNRANRKPILTFTEWVTLYDRLADAREARANPPVKARKNTAQAVVAKVAATVKPQAAKPAFTRVEFRVDCFANQGQNLLLGVDKGHGGTLIALLGGVAVDTYTSKRGERERVLVPNAKGIERKLSKAGFNPRGF